MRCEGKLAWPCSMPRTRGTRGWRILVMGLLTWFSSVPGELRGQDAGATGTSATQPDAASAPAYRLYVANESSDILSRVLFVPGEGVEVEAEVPVGIMPMEPDSPHGLAISPDGEFIYVSLAHGTPFGYAWKLHAGPDTLVARTTLGRFPASMGTTPDGEFLLVANFNLHGDMVPSDVSVVHTPTMTEVARVETCLMPHGSRVNSSGTRHYSTCMHSEQLVEFDLTTFQISSRFSVAPGMEGPLELDNRGERHSAHHAPERICSPTWATPGTGSRQDRVVYVACNALDEVLEVDVEKWEVLRRFPTGRSPYNLEPTPDGRLLVVSLKGGQGVSIIDLESGTEAARLETSRAITHGVAMSPDSRYAFISNESVGSLPGSMDVIDLESLERVAWVELRHQSGGITFWRMTEN